MLDAQIKRKYCLLAFAVFGRPALGEFEPECSITESEARDVDAILETLPGKWSGAVVRIRFGLDDGQSKTLEETGNHFSVTRERIRQIEAKALRRLRHPSRNKTIRRGYPTALAIRVAHARQELYEKLAQLYPRSMAFQVARNVDQDDLAIAFKSTEEAIKSSCGANISHCLNCGNPLPPGWTLCNYHCRSQYKVIKVACSYCGKLFDISTNRVLRSETGRNYCSRSCQGKMLSVIRDTGVSNEELEDRIERVDRRLSHMKELLRQRREVTICQT